VDRSRVAEGHHAAGQVDGGKATRDFTNHRHPAIVEDDYRGARAIIDGRFKLVIHQRPDGERRELFDLRADPAETTDLSAQQAATVERLQAQLRTWQQSVLHSLTGADYPN
jgi:arylsulfatase A-like enzyme